MSAVLNGAKVESATKLPNFGRLPGLLCAVSIAWVGIWMPCNVLVWLLQLWRMVGVWEEIIPLCFLVILSVGLLIGLIRNLLGERAR